MKRMVLLIQVFLLFSIQSAGAAGLEQYRERHAKLIARDRIASQTCELSDGVNVAPSFSLSGDIILNDDNNPETFSQRSGDVAVFPDGTFAVVWEDDRNGDFDIYGQLFSVSGSPSGPEVRLIHDSYFGDQRMAACDADSAARLIVAWIDEDGSVRAQTFDQSLTATIEPLVINDNADSDLRCNLPDVAWLSGGGAAVVWEDSRDGVNAYCQLLTATMTRSGVNILLSTSAPETEFWAPNITSAGSHGFAVSWDVISTVGAGIVMRTYALNGVPQSGLIAPPDAMYSSADQFSSAVAHLSGIGFVTFWLDTREYGQRVFAQKLNYSGVKIGSNVLMCDAPDDVCWDVAASALPNGSIRAVWASQGDHATILTSMLTSTGSRSGSNVCISQDGMTGDRFSPGLDCTGNNGAIAIWTDFRTGEPDILVRSLDSAGLPAGSEGTVETPIIGAQQHNPRVALTDHGLFGAVWRDCRFDEGDIFMQFLSEDGTSAGDNLKVNTDIGAALQSEPTIGSNGEGEAIVAWVDARQVGASSGQQVYARRYRFSSPDGTDFKVSNDPLGAVKHSPDAAFSLCGSSVITWQDHRDGVDNIYAQLITADGDPVGSNLKINTLPTLGACSSPRVGMAADGSFVIAWLAMAGERQLAFYQVYSNAGTPVGSNAMYPCDSSEVSHLSVDMDFDQKHSMFVVALIQRSDAGENEVVERRLSSTGNPLGGELVVSDNPALLYGDVSVSVDHDGYCAEAWSDSRSGHSRVYRAIPGIHGAQAISIAADSREQRVGVALSGRVCAAVWMGSRASTGNDILANLYSYSSSAADHDENELIPSSFRLAQNYPNPFNPTTTISFFIPAQSDVSIEVLNLLGQVVYAQNRSDLSAGWHSIVYDAAGAASGVYFYRVTTERGSSTRKMALIK